MNITGDDPHFLAPVWTLNTGTNVVATVILGLLALAALGYAIAMAVRVGRWYPLFVLAGAGLAIFTEPFIDLLGHIAFPHESNTVIETFGRPLPMYVLLAYFFYFSAPCLWVMTRIRPGMTERSWWTYYSAFVVLGFLEALPIHYGWWTYYGDNQPFEVFGLPTWWAFVNAYLLVTIGLICRLVVRYVPDQRFAPLLILVIPVSAWTLYTSVSVPVYAAINGTTSTGVTRLVSLVTIVLTLLMITLTGKIAAHHARTLPSTAAAEREDSVMSKQVASRSAPGR